MKIRMMFLMFCLMAITPAVFAQTINLFDATPITRSDSRFPPNGPFVFEDAISFGTAYVSCPASGTGTVSGVDGGNFIVDNFLTVNGTDICPGGPKGNCFSSAPGPFIQGASIETGFAAVTPINISNLLSAGGIYTFNLMDYGGVFGNTEVNLNDTNCQLIPQTEDGKFVICHRQGGNGKNVKFKTLYVGDIVSVEDHLEHGHQPGTCE